MIYIVLSGFLFRSPTLYGGNMQNAVIDLTTSIVEFGRFDINPYYFNSPDIALKDGNYYSGMAPGSSIVAIPLYVIAKAIWSITPNSIQQRIDRKVEGKGLITYSSKVNPYYSRQTLASALMSLVFGYLGGALAFWLVTRIALFVSGDKIIALQTGIVYCFATVMIFYHNSYYTQSIATLFLLIAAYLLLVKPPQILSLICGMFFSGLSGTIDYPFLVYGGILTSFAMIRLWRNGQQGGRIIAVAIAYIMPVLAMFAYHWACFGGPLKTPYGYRAAQNILHTKGFLGISLFRPDRIFAFFFNPYEGSLTLMPFLFLFPFGAWFIYKKYRQERNYESEERLIFVLCSMSIIFLAFCYFVSVPWISYMTAYGPRFFLAAIPFMTILAYPYDQRLRIPFWILVGYSLIVNQLNMVTLNLPKYIYESVTQQPVSPLSVMLFQVKKTFPPLTGITILFTLQIILITAIFIMPAMLRKKQK